MAATEFWRGMTQNLAGRSGARENFPHFPHKNAEPQQNRHLCPTAAAVIGGECGRLNRRSRP